MSTPIQSTTDELSFLDRRNALLKNVHPDIIKRAWFTLSHLLLDDGAVVADMGCFDGTLTYAMAAMNPKVKFIGVDKSKRQISKATETYKLDNLEFKTGDTVADIFPEESLDAIINAYILHEVYSASRYNERIVSDTLRRQFRMLKKNGIMFIEDYANPGTDEFILMEMADIPGNSSDIQHMSEPDLLIWYSQYARPRQDPGCSGFFLEELPSRFPKTRLFRLPHKWAYEFILRKDNRAHWDSALPIEYTFFTIREFRRELQSNGARVQYSGPYWDDDNIEKNLEKNIRFFSDNGTPLAPPATCFVAVSTKMVERKSLQVEERRPSSTKESSLKITAMRDNKTGKLSDVVSRSGDTSEIIPYYVTADNTLKIYLHDGIVKSIANAVPRKGVNIEEKQWSGHMIEAVAVESSTIFDLGNIDSKNTALFCRDHLGIKPKNNAILERGSEYYPSPEYIDEKITTYYLNSEKTAGTVSPRNVVGNNDRFLAKGVLREFDAQQILNAIAIGMIPNARLELQILSLFQRLNIPAENWTDKKLKLHAGQISGDRSLKKVLDSHGLGSAGRFKEIKGTAGQLRNVHSTFVEEGQQRGTITGLTAQDQDFVIFDEHTINTAVVLPLANLGGEVNAAFLLDQMPVPDRRDGNGLTASALSFHLPPDVTNMHLARKYVAEQFSVMPEMVVKMGECYFNHVGITPQKIYPFAVAVPGNFAKDPNVVFMPLYQIMLMWKALSRNHNFSLQDGARPKMSWDTNLMVNIGRSYRFLHQEFKFDAKLQVQSIVKDRLAQRAPDWSIPLGYRQAPSIQSREPSLSAPAPSLAATGMSPTWHKAEPLPSETASTEKQASVTPAITNPSSLPNLIADFERELETIFKDLDANDHKSPRPEKW